jgi:hypothetical protein
MTDQTEPRIHRILLSEAQSRSLWPILHLSKQETGVSGLLCSINQHWNRANGGLVLELQIARLNREVTRKIQELLLTGRKEPK